jgi:hypothetical protein
MSEGEGPKPTKGRIQAVLGGGHRTGRWYVADTTSVLAVFGRTVIDLRHAESSSERLVFKCLSVFGSVCFVVDEATNVRTSGIAVLASQRSAIPATDAPSDAPIVEIDATTALGRLHVLTEVPRSRAERRAIKAAAKLDRRAERAGVEPRTEPADPSPDAWGTSDRDDAFGGAPTAHDHEQAATTSAAMRLAAPRPAPAEPFTPFDVFDREPAGPLPERPTPTADMDKDAADVLAQMAASFDPEGPPRGGAARSQSLAEALPDTTQLDPAAFATDDDSTSSRSALGEPTSGATDR